MATEVYCVNTSVFAEVLECSHRLKNFSPKKGKFFTCKAKREDCTYARGPGYAQKLNEDHK